MSFSPEAVHVVEVPAASQAPDTYFFSDGQQPPNIVAVWYENPSEHTDPGEAVVMADGPVPEELFKRSLQTSSADEDIADAGERALNEAPRPDTLTLELRKDPRQTGPEAALEVALVAARCMFALANSQE